MTAVDAETTLTFIDSMGVRLLFDAGMRSAQGANSLVLVGTDRSSSERSSSATSSAGCRPSSSSQVGWRP
jgi:hypothetical protein